jgi:hypothetical protein
VRKASFESAASLLVSVKRRASERVILSKLIWAHVESKPTVYKRFCPSLFFNHGCHVYRILLGASLMLKMSCSQICLLIMRNLLDLAISLLSRLADESDPVDADLFIVAFALDHEQNKTRHILKFHES